MAKLPPRYNVVVLPFVLTMLMTIIVSGISTFNAIGLEPGWLGTWFESWMISWAAAFPVMVFVLPVARRLVGRVVEPPRA
ncbi:MAG: DUF2798 domain-containing protein [Hyphomicrobiaceae bacterium]|nr:DUF2798 domain-containing protein [Hyphomicrobiaceae bacterium]